MKNWFQIFSKSAGRFKFYPYVLEVKKNVLKLFKKNFYLLIACKKIPKMSKNYNRHLVLEIFLLCMHSTEGLFVMAIATTSHYNFLTFLESFYRVDQQCCPGGNCSETPRRPSPGGLHIYKNQAYCSQI
jgi:hypothetical protein